MCSTQELSKILYDSALSYLNIDTAVSGRDHISVAATPLLYKATYKAAKMVKTASLSNVGLSPQNCITITATLVGLQN